MPSDCRATRRCEPSSTARALIVVPAIRVEDEGRVRIKQVDELGHRTIGRHDPTSHDRLEQPVAHDDMVRLPEVHNRERAQGLGKSPVFSTIDRLFVAQGNGPEQ